jgi:hypothetical protein
MRYFESSLETAQQSRYTNASVRLFGNFKSGSGAKKNLSPVKRRGRLLE